MFKKPVDVRGRTAVRDSDRRRLRAAAQALGGPAVAEDAALAAAVADAWAALLPLKRPDVEVVRVTTHAGVDVRVYTTAREPVLVEVDRPVAVAGAPAGTPRLALFPTVVALARLPPATLPPLLTHAALLPVLVRGADLMAPGVVAPSEGGLPALHAHAGQLRTLWVRGCATPVGVGVVTAAGAAGARLGKALLVLHVHGDHLWKLGAKAPLPASAPSLPLLPPPYGVHSADEEDDADALAAAAVDQGDEDDSWASVDAAAEAPPRMADAASADDGASDDDGDDAHAQRPAATAAAAAATAAAAEGAPGPPVPEMEALLEAALLLSLRRTVKDRDLPLLASTLYAQHMLPAAPGGHVIDVKASSYKKVAHGPCMHA
jgi:predicted ribosome-associated RNA-binding protein Tma20